MEALLQQIEGYKAEMQAATISDAAALEQFRIKYLGTKGLVKAVMGEMKQVPADQKKSFGQILNDFKLFAEARFEELEASLGNTHPETIKTGFPIMMFYHHSWSTQNHQP